MRGDERIQDGMFSYVPLEQRVPADHPLREVRKVTDAVLRRLNAETVLISGVLTNQCIGATCKDALFRDFKPIVVEECVGTATPHLHDPAIEMIRMGWGQVNALQQTLDELAAFPDRDRRAALDRHE